MKDFDDSILLRTWHHSRFADLDRLVRLKREKGLSISLGFPTLNEEATIGKEVLVIKSELMDRYPLLDEIAVIDSGSTDNTKRVAERFGASFYSSSSILHSRGTYRGKGENLWKSLYALKGDLIVWVDADIANISAKFVYGLLGPLLEDDSISYVKGFYERPIRSRSALSSSGGGRVTELLVRPLFSLYYPELACMVQPLSGEYAGRRSLLERLSFSVGYGVELGHLIDILKLEGTGALAQVDLDLRVHRNQSVEALGKMSFGILNTFFERATRYGDIGTADIRGEAHLSLQVLAEEHRLVKTALSRVERPPMLELSEYRKKFKG